MIAALFVEAGGCYFGREDVDPWDRARDARRYAGPLPVVAHPPCQRWGRFWHGSPRKPHQFKLGDDDGCFEHALWFVRRWGGVLEHPAYSHAWKFYGLSPADHAGGWKRADKLGGWTCHIEQGWYGHVARKPTWLYAFGTERPDLKWGKGEQRLAPGYVERHGYEKARRCGVMAAIGGKHKNQIRAATPPHFAEILLSIAESAND